MFKDVTLIHWSRQHKPSILGGSGILMVWLCFSTATDEYEKYYSRLLLRLSVLENFTESFRAVSSFLLFIVQKRG